MSNPSRVALPPEIDPGAPLPALPAPPAPPDVPEDGLLVQGGPEDSSDLPGGVSGPSAFAALVYEVPLREAADTLALTLAEGAASTPLAPVRACPLTTNIIQPAQGGPMSDAPEFDCTTEILAEPTDGGTRYEWPIAELESNGIVAVALLAVGANDRIVFAAPDDASLVTMPSDDTPTPTTDASDDQAAAPAVPPQRPSGVSSAPPISAATPSEPPAPPAEEVAAPAPVVADVTPGFESSAVVSEEFDAVAAVLAILVLSTGSVGTTITNSPRTSADACSPFVCTATPPTRSGS